MATAYTTIGSKFQPYTLAEMLVPYQTYKQEFDKREELYNTYAENAGLIGSQLDDTLDKDLMDETTITSLRPDIKADVVRKRNFSISSLILKSFSI